MKSAKEMMREQALEIKDDKEFYRAKKNILKHFEKVITNSVKGGDFSVELVLEQSTAFQAALEEVKQAGYEVRDVSDHYKGPTIEICWLMGGEDID